MPVRLTAAAIAELFPRAAKSARDPFVAKQDVLDRHGVTETRERLAMFLAQIGHESGGLTIAVENINYTPSRMAQVWPNRFKSADDVKRKYGTGPDWRTKAFDDIYGNRMGNRPGTSDGSTYIGRGPIQITGRDGYATVGKIANLPLVENPTMAASPTLGPDIACAFWTWKKLNPVCDKGDFRALTKLINGGYNGMADREAWLKRARAVVAKLPVEADGFKPLPPPPDIPAPDHAAPAPQQHWLVRFILAIFKRS